MSMDQKFVPPAGISNDVRLGRIIKSDSWTQASYKGRNGNWAYITRFVGKKEWAVAVAYDGEIKGRVIDTGLRRAEAILAACRHCE